MSFHRHAAAAIRWSGAGLVVLAAACMAAEGGSGTEGFLDLDGGGGVRAPGSGGASSRTKSPPPATAASSTPKPTPSPTPASMEADGWEPQKSGTTADLHAVIVRGQKSGRPWAWAVGDGGVILRTSDGGATWQKMESGTPRNLYAINYYWLPVQGVAGSESYSLIAGGEAGTLLLSSTSGLSWVPLPPPIASKSTDPPGDVRQVDIWPTHSANAPSTQGRVSIFVSSTRYPLVMSPNASDSGKMVWDEEGKAGSANAYPVPVRDDASWLLTLTGVDARFRFSFFSVASDRAYGLLFAGKDVCSGGAATCIGYPLVSGDVRWRWRLPSTQFEGVPTDIATVTDNANENLPCDVKEFDYVAYLSTTMAIYRTADYGKTWKKILPARADRLISTGTGRIVAVSPTQVWHGKAIYPSAPPAPATPPPCPKTEPTFAWVQVTRGSELEANPDDNFLGGVRSTDQAVFNNDLWLVGKGGKILHRPGQAP